MHSAVALALRQHQQQQHATDAKSMTDGSTTAVNRSNLSWTPLRTTGCLWRARTILLLVLNIVCMGCGRCGLTRRPQAQRSGHLSTLTCVRRANFLAGANVMLEEEHPDIVAGMAEYCATVRYRIVDGGAKLVSERSGSVHWHASMRGTGLTAAYGTALATYDSAVAAGIQQADIFSYNSAPFTRELPDPILRHVGEETDSRIAQRFRLYIEHGFLPPMRRVAELLSAHAAVVDTPPTDWLRDRFPDEAWHALPPSLYRYAWLARRKAWEAVLASWREGDMGLTQPRGATMYPFGKRTTISGPRAIVHDMCRLIGVCCDL
eukprot:SAG31_NODE_1823_length_7191_cov_9.623519_4_plen_320_part_00